MFDNHEMRCSQRCDSPVQRRLPEWTGAQGHRLSHCRIAMGDVSRISRALRVDRPCRSGRSHR
ncbi:hypothetical protein C3479_28050, partial [Mycobacterium kansasii]